MSEYIIEVVYDTSSGAFLHKCYEEVVRCKDCKHYRDRINGCALLAVAFANVEPDGFCAWGGEEGGGGMRVAWFSCGLSSFLAAKMGSPDKVIYIHVGNQHPDSLRFLADSRALLGMPIEVLQSPDYNTVDEVILKDKYINGAGGARCTLVLKKRVRQKWEMQNWARHTYIWGYDVDERNRAERIIDSMPEFDHEFPLIDAGLTKSDVHAICSDLGLVRPVMYDMGYPNNNCVGCVKGGKGYWNRIRVDFPKVFERRAAQEREIGRSCIKGVFLDELNPDEGISNPVVPSCSIDCYIAESEMGVMDGS